MVSGKIYTIFRKYKEENIICVYTERLFFDIKKVNVNFLRLSDFNNFNNNVQK